MVGCLAIGLPFRSLGPWSVGSILAAVTSARVLVFCDLLAMPRSCQELAGNSSHVGCPCALRVGPSKTSKTRHSSVAKAGDGEHFGWVLVGGLGLPLGLAHGWSLGHWFALSLSVPMACVGSILAPVAVRSTRVLVCGDLLAMPRSRQELAGNE
jgi:hypothetical protein